MKFLTPMLATMVVIFGCAKGTTWVKPSTGFGEVRRVAVLPFQSNKEVRAKAKNDNLLKNQLEKEREQLLINEIEKNEKERIKKKGLKTLK